MKKIILILLLLNIICYPQSGKILLYFDSEVTYNQNAKIYFESLTAPLADSIKLFLSETCDCLDDSLNSGARNKTLIQLGIDALWLLANQTTEAAL